MLVVVSGKVVRKTLVITMSHSDMYVCLCNAISDKVIRNAVRQHQPQSMQQLRKLVPIGTDCGKCIRQARVIFEEEQAKIPDMYEVA